MTESRITREELVSMIEEGLFDADLTAIKDAITERSKLVKAEQKVVAKEQLESDRIKKAAANRENTKIGDIVVVSYGGQEDLPDTVMARVTGTTAKTCSFTVLNDDGTVYLRKIGGLEGKALILSKKWWAFDNEKVEEEE